MARSQEEDPAIEAVEPAGATCGPGDAAPTPQPAQQSGQVSEASASQRTQAPGDPGWELPDGSGRTPFDLRAFMAQVPEYQHELQNRQLERMRSNRTSSRGFTSSNSTTSALSRALTGSAGSSSANHRSLSHTDSSSTHSGSAHNGGLSHHGSLPASPPQRLPSIPQQHSAVIGAADAAGASADLQAPPALQNSVDFDWIFRDSAASDSDTSSRTTSGMHSRTESAPLAWDPNLDLPYDEQMARTSMSSESSGNSGHYNPQNDVISRMETLGEKPMKAIVSIINAAEYLGIAIAVVVVICRATSGRNTFLRHDYLWAVNVGVGGLCFVSLLTMTTVFLNRLWQAYRAGKHWSPRRKLGTTWLVVEVLTQLFNLCLFLAANIYVLIGECVWFTPATMWTSFVSFLCWDTLFCLSVMRAHCSNLWVDKQGQSKGPRADATIMDAPVLATHWPLALLWLAGAAIKIAAVTQYNKITQLPSVRDANLGCRDQRWDCKNTAASASMLSLAVALFTVYISMFLFFLLRTFRQLSTRPYRDYRMSNFSARFTLRTRTLALWVYVLCIITYAFVQFNNCSSWAAEVMGYLPMHLIFTAISCIECFTGMPKDPNDHKQILQVWLQEFAWTECEKLSKIKSRGSSLPAGDDLLHEPMFCFETSVKLYYYAHMVYDYQHIFDETFDDKKRASKGKDTCDHIDMCPIASTAKFKRRCQEGKHISDADRCKPCHEGGFWGCLRQILGLHPCPEEVHMRPSALEQNQPHTMSTSSMLAKPSHWLSKLSRPHGTSDPNKEQLQVAGLRRPKAPKDKRKRNQKQKSKLGQHAAAGIQLKAAEEGVADRFKGHTASPLDTPEHTIMQNGPSHARDGGDSDAPASASSKSLSQHSDGSAGHDADTEAHEPDAQRSGAFGRLLRSLSRMSSCSGCGRSDSSRSDEEEDEGHKPDLADTHAKLKPNMRERRTDKPEFMLDTALGMYDLKHVEVFWERMHDTHALLAWGPSRCVIVFRGTASFANVLADLQAWQLVHPPKRGSWWMGTQPMVHKGFLQSWTANSFNKRLVDRVMEVATDAAANPKLPKFLVMVTGHSLGGAVSKLAAYDIAKATQSLPIKVHVVNYTFGAPRVGNHAFALDYNKVVWDSWSVINDQDLIARQAKFFTWYKRPGQRVIINPQGDLLVRPTFVEMSIHKRPFSSSVSQHYLLSYRTSLAAVVKAQLDRRKRIHGGLAGMMRVLEGQFLRDILAPAGVVYDEVLKESRWAHALDRTSWKARKHKTASLHPNSFRIRAPVLARARRLDEDAAAAAVAAADGYPGGWEGIDFSSAMSCRPCSGHHPSPSVDYPESHTDGDGETDMGPNSVAVTIADQSEGEVEDEMQQQQQQS